MGLSYILLVGFLAIGMYRETLRPLLNFLGPQNISTAGMTPDPLAAARLLRSDNEMQSSKLQPARKGGLAMTRISLSGISIVNNSGIMASGFENDELANADSAPAQTATSTAINTPATEQVLGLKIAPILRKDKNTGQLEIGNFKPMSLVGDSDECLNIGYSMLGDTGSSNDLLDVLTASDEITVAKICANNGSIVISCRGDQITVSPRRSRPDDKCQRSG